MVKLKKRYFSLSTVYDIFIFIFTFSLFNDKLVADTFGIYALKSLFFIFLLFLSINITKYIKKTTLNINYILFYFFIFLWVIVILINTILLSDMDIINNLMKVIAIFSIVIFYSQYNLKKILYMIWFSMLVSVVDCHFSDTISQWTFRRSGGTEDPNEFASQLLMTLFISFYLYKQNHNKIFIFFTISALIYGLLMAGSKSSFLSLGFIIIYGLLKFYKQLFNFKYIILILSLIFISFQLENIELVQDILIRAQSNGTADARFRLWESGYAMIQNHPILGIGMGNFIEDSITYSVEYLALGAQTAHNMYILWFSENGLIVFMLLLIFIFILLKKNYNSILTSDNFYLQLALLSSLLMGMTISMSYEKYLWLIIAIYINVQNNIDQKLEGKSV